MPCTCHGCGRRYRVDVLVSDELWGRIGPRDRQDPGAGLLCGPCILAAIERLGEHDAYALVADTAGAAPASDGYALLVVSAGVRYWEDASVNGVEDGQGDLVPFRNGDNWEPVVELATGRILDWPEGTTGDIHYKVCDAGEYWLADASGNKVAKWKGHYVPNDLLCVGADGYGDYIILSVGADGRIEGWEPPRIDVGEWEHPSSRPSPAANAVGLRTE